MFKSLKQRLKNKFFFIVKANLHSYIEEIAMNMIMHRVRYFVDKDKCFISPTAQLSNAFLNTNSGSITIGDLTFCGQNVVITTGTHDYNVFNEDRVYAIPLTGQDISIGKGVWIGTNAVILGPCKIGDNAVVGAGAVVTKDVAANSIVAGVPARVIKSIKSL